MYNNTKGFIHIIIKTLNTNYKDIDSKKRTQTSDYSCGQVLSTSISWLNFSGVININTQAKYAIKLHLNSLVSTIERIAFATMDLLKRIPNKQQTVLASAMLCKY